MLERLLIGCEDGSVIVLDGQCKGHNENYSILKVKIGDYGGIVCVDISYNGNNIATGYSSGAVGYWDIKKKQCVKIINNIFDSAVLQLKFVSSDSLLISDNRGNVSVTRIKKNLFAYNNENNMILSHMSSSVY